MPSSSLADYYGHPLKTMLFKDQLEITYLDTGEGEKTLIFVHGLSSNLAAWRKNIDLLKKYYRCIALDLPGHGLSTRGDYPYTQSFYAKVFDEFVKRLRVQNICVVGHSMGGQIATRAVLNNPELFSELVLAAPAGFETFSSTERMLLKQFSGNLIGGSQYFQGFSGLGNYFFSRQTAEEERLIMLNAGDYSLSEQSMSKKILLRSMNSMSEEAVFEELPQLALPVLVIFGKNDLLIPNKFMHPMHSTESVAKEGTLKIPGAVLKLYEQCGHFLQFEQSARFNVDLYKFLNQHIFKVFNP